MAPKCGSARFVRADGGRQRSDCGDHGCLPRALPRSRILVLVFLFFFIDVIEIPAVFFLAFWFVMQLLSGIGQVAHASGANIGFWAHAGGFLTGLGGVFLFRRRERQKVEWWSYD